MESFEIQINNKIMEHEVPNLRESVGWDRRESDYPLLFERCLFWGSLRNEEGELIAFGYIAGPGIEHGYLEDVIVHPDYQEKGIGNSLVKTLLQEAHIYGISIITVTYQDKHKAFYENCGFTACAGGVWRRE
ncbi:GNAT family N-acetyltransferase [Cohnella lupini]|uniref:Acetyltransferase (GNAT) family protein n=1 Tax=Cohnella lupini TaxID=1294267 RepID=A0A3D9IXB8_9BACL|nr:GNAT family N-acetyltransferase [Cohnella lupini]RED66149.1 acetyltransferase (GNAT) family protein [Cohnella lupini]